MSATNSQELRDLIQGPGDVEWRYVLSLCFQTSREFALSKRRYDMRHQCQEILPGLLLGPFQVSKDLVSLKELGISHMYASFTETFVHTPEPLSLWLSRIQSLHSRCKRIIFSPPSFPRIFRVSRSRCARFRGTESDPLISKVWVAYPSHWHYLMPICTPSLQSPTIHKCCPCQKWARPCSL
jgi:hypothetical protein